MLMSDFENILTLDEYRKLFQKCLDYTLWYMSKYGGNSNRIRQKMRDKGYPEQVSYTDSAGDRQDVNLFDAIVDELVDLCVLDDNRFLEDYVDKQISRGKSFRQIRSEVYGKRIPAENLDKILASRTENVDIAIEKVVKQSSFARLDSAGKRRKLYRTLTSKGFTVDSFADKIEDFIV